MIGSRLEADASAAACRLAFYGRLVALVDAPERPGALARLRLLKLKARTGSVERVAPDGGSAVCKGMFKRDTDISRFVGLKARARLAAGACAGRSGFGCDGVGWRRGQATWSAMQQPAAAPITTQARVLTGVARTVV